jgi:hypothetical protein
MRILAVLAAFTLVGAGFAQTINFTFDADSQGWTKGDLGSTRASTAVGTEAANWDPVIQAIAGNDHSNYAFLFSPDLGGGFGGLIGEDLRFDFLSATAGPQYPFVTLLSGTEMLFYEQSVPASPGLLPYSIKLDSSASWYLNSSPYFNGTGAVLATEADIQRILGDLRHIGVSTDIVGGADDTRLDNVQAVPEPGTMALIAGAAALIAWRRQRKSA